MKTAIGDLREFWETLTPESVERLERVYAQDACFRDPFNDVRGVEELKRVFRHMFATLDQPKFAILEVVANDFGAILIWDFTFRVKAWKPKIVRSIHGVSHLRFAPEGRVIYHRDYWDAAGELYSQLPLIGRVVRMLEAKFSAD